MGGRSHTEAERPAPTARRPMGAAIPARSHAPPHPMATNGDRPLLPPLALLGGGGVAIVTPFPGGRGSPLLLLGGAVQSPPHY